MYQWKGINLSPMKIFATFIRGSDTNITEIKGQFDCCDNEVNDFKDPISSLKHLEELEWVLIETKDEDGGSIGYRSLTYQSSQNILIALVCGYNDCPGDAEALIYISEDYFVIVGNVGSHPFVETPFVRYCNSDGSGPDIFKKTSLDDPNPKQFAKNLVKYYKDFLQNKWH